VAPDTITDPLPLVEEKLAPRILIPYSNKSTRKEDVMGVRVYDRLKDGKY
jgi:hypothetical protein